MKTYMDKQLLDPCSLSEAQRRMNTWGAMGQPFVFLIDFEMRKPIVAPAHLMDESRFLCQIGRADKPAPPLVKGYHFRRQPIPIAGYQQAFEMAQREIKAGNSYLLNLTFPTLLQTNLTLRDIFRLSTARYRVYLKGQFTCFSPETFVKIDPNGYIYSYPMKGTATDTGPEAEALLLQDPKEQAEHATIVDLIRNDLSMVAKQVRVTRYRYVERLSTHKGGLLQSSTEIRGKLPSNYRSALGDLLLSLLPAGSISGAPKAKTVAIIQEAEQQERGYYTGVCGLFDGQALDSGVMIRYIEEREGQRYFRSGGGITARSQMRAEYEEMIAKAYLPFATVPHPAL